MGEVCELPVCPGVSTLALKPRDPSRVQARTAETESASEYHEPNTQRVYRGPWHVQQEAVALVIRPARQGGKPHRGGPDLCDRKWRHPARPLPRAARGRQWSRAPRLSRKPKVCCAGWALPQPLGLAGEATFLATPSADGNVYALGFGVQPLCLPQVLGARPAVGPAAAAQCFAGELEDEVEHHWKHRAGEAGPGATPGAERARKGRRSSSGPARNRRRPRPSRGPPGSARSSRTLSLYRPMAR